MSTFIISILTDLHPGRLKGSRKQHQQSSEGGLVPEMRRSAGFYAGSSLNFLMILQRSDQADAPSVEPVILPASAHTKITVKQHVHMQNKWYCRDLIELLELCGLSVSLQSLETDILACSPNVLSLYFFKFLKNLNLIGVT